MSTPLNSITREEAKALRAIMRGAAIDPAIAKHLMRHNLAQNSIASCDMLGNPTKRALIVAHEGHRQVELYKSRTVDKWWTRVLSIVAIIISIIAIIAAQK